jgi:hypothetical protein
MRVKMKLNRLLLTLVVVAQAAGLSAQQTFKYRAEIGKIDKSAFYRIVLLPEVRAKSNAEMADIRILSHGGKVVPYIFGSQLPVKMQQSFITFPRVNTANQPDTATTFVAENRNRLNINQLNLKLRNTSVDRMVTLAGSDDLANWFAIKENILLSKAAGEGGSNGVYEQLLNFPASNYRYFKVQVNNNRKNPVAILQAGIYKTQSVTALYIALPGVKYSQKDSGKVSRVYITFDKPYPVNRLKLTVSGTKYYKRTVRIYAQNGKKRQLLSDTSIISTWNDFLYLSAKTRNLILEIPNDDNAPLSISAIEAYQLDQSLVAYLNKGESYHVLFGDTAATTPVYDLQFFADSLQRDLSMVQTGDITANPAYQHKAVINKPQIPTWLIWVAIIGVIALLTFLTFKMTREVAARKSEGT